MIGQVMIQNYGGILDGALVYGALIMQNVEPVEYNPLGILITSAYKRGEMKSSVLS